MSDFIIDNGVLTKYTGPGGDVVIPEGVTAIGEDAFSFCALTTVVLPESVTTIGEGAFSYCCALTSVFNDSSCPVLSQINWDGKDLERIIDGYFPGENWEEVTPIRKMPLAVSCLRHPEKYSDGEREQYLTYLRRQSGRILERLAAGQDVAAAVAVMQTGFIKPAGYQKALAAAQGNPAMTAAILEYRAANVDLAKEAVREERAMMSPKPNELQKVEILEEVVRKGSLEDLKAVLDTYKTFEMTARALGLASRYRGVDFVRTLAEHGATFVYKSGSALQKKYKMDQVTVCGSYSTEYYLMAVPEKLDFTEKNIYDYTPTYAYTPMYGVTHMGISDELEATRLPLKDRLEVVRYYFENEKLGVSFDEMLFWALTRNELDFADALIAMGVNLKKTPPTYYSSGGMVTTYLDLVTSGSQTVYWTSYLYRMTSLKAEQVLAVFQRLNTLARAADKKLIMPRTFFDKLDWNDALLSFALENMVLSGVSQKKALETAVSASAVSALAIMADAGWIAQPEKRNKLIEFARENGKIEALAWLMDYKNRTADVVAEEAKAEAKMMRALTEDPNSVSALKKVWSYKKQEDGSLVITSYKGDATEVVIPSVIGKAPVTKIGEEAFSPSHARINWEERKKIVSVVIPEGVTTIGERAFSHCRALTTVVIPEGVTTIGEEAFYDCRSLTSVEIPEGVTDIGKRAFDDCSALTSVVLPESVTTIGEEAFIRCNALTSIVIPGSVTTIGESAFSYCSALTSIVIPESVTSIGEWAFSGCQHLTSVVIPKSVITIRYGAFHGCSNLTIHAPAGGYAERYAKKKSIPFKAI